ncbi:MAG: nucleoside hydrolase [Chloroflexi bacterium]|nr:MAG: nucleoside hydrolase [Chloroflexota bacterium]
MSAPRPNPLPLSTPYPPSPRRAPVGTVAKPLPLIIDCDPGHDDAMAIAIAVARPELKLLGVTTVAGNATLPRTFENARRVLALLGAGDTPVAAGAAVPLVRPLFTAAYVHGESGLEGAEMPEPGGRVHEAGAVDLIARLVEASPEPVVLAPLGPLTNIALFLRAHPELAKKIAHISWMGGAIGEGNVTASAEFNVYVDPEAAAEVFSSGIPITMVGLDVTHLARMGAAETARLDAAGNRAGKIFADLLRYFLIFHRERYEWEFCAIHDAVAVAHLVDPDLVGVVHAAVDVELGDLARGRTIVDWFPQRLVERSRSASADVAVSIDSARFADLLIGAIATFD